MRCRSQINARDVVREDGTIVGPAASLRSHEKRFIIRENGAAPYATQSERPSEHSDGFAVYPG